MYLQVIQINIIIIIINQIFVYGTLMGVDYKSEKKI